MGFTDLAVQITRSASNSWTHSFYRGQLFVIGDDLGVPGVSEPVTVCEAFGLFTGKKYTITDYIGSGGSDVFRARDQGGTLANREFNVLGWWWVALFFVIVALLIAWAMKGRS